VLASFTEEGAALRWAESVRQLNPPWLLDVVQAYTSAAAFFDPDQVNYLTLGNQLPHLHTNVVLRYVDDPAPGGMVDLNSGAQIADDELERQSNILGALLRESPLSN